MRLLQSKARVEEFREGETPREVHQSGEMKGQPCFAYQTNSCQYGDACRYKHVKTSQEEYSKLKKKREEALLQRRAKGTSLGERYPFQVKFSEGCGSRR